MTKITINDSDEFLVTKEKELELRDWLEENSDMIIESPRETGDSIEDELIIEFEPNDSIIYNKGEVEDNEE